MSANIGGAGALLMMFGPAVVGGVAGALIGGSKHRLLGAGIGVGAGFGATLVYAKIQSAQSQAAVGGQLQPASTLQTNVSYGLSLPSGGDPTATAQAAGFTQISNINGTYMGIWSGANNAPTPPGLVAVH